MQSFRTIGDFVLALASLCLTAMLHGQSLSPNSFQSLLPVDSQIIETADLNVGGGKVRALVLWMTSPKRTAAGDTCPDYVYGDHWFGPTNLSLIDTSNRKLINTIRIRSSNEMPEDKGGFAVPFFVSESLSPYLVPHPDKDEKGKPLLLNLQDLTGEGADGEFALFDYAACGIEDTSVFGYSRKSDRVVQYPIEVVEGRFKPVLQSWVMQIFATKPIRPGYWDFTWEPGHGFFAWIHEEVRFDPLRQLFVDRQTIKPYPGLAEAHCNLQINGVPGLLREVGQIVPDFDDSKMRDLQNLINTTPANHLTGTSVGVTFQGEEVEIDVKLLKSDRGEIGIRFMTTANLATAIRTEARGSCADE